jgi:hypothetical protein
MHSATGDRDTLLRNNGGIAVEDDMFTPSTEPNSKSPWIRYSVEYRYSDTDGLIHRKILSKDDFKAYKQGVGVNQEDDCPAFELVSKYRASRIRQSDSQEREDNGPPSTLSRPSYYLHIYSLAIINALQSIVQYYPDQDLSGDSIVVPWPYPILAHHYDELANFREQCVGRDPATLCVRERNADEHIKLLLDFLDEHVMADVREEMERNRKSFVTFGGLWVALKLGVTIVKKHDEDEQLTAGVVHSVRGGISSNPPEEWVITYWTMQYDGQHVGRYNSTVRINRFDGEAKDRFKIIPDFTAAKSINDKVLMKMSEHGETYWKLLKKQCRYYKGNTTEFPRNEVSRKSLSILEPDADRPVD